METPFYSRKKLPKTATYYYPEIQIDTVGTPAQTHDFGFADVCNRYNSGLLDPREVSHLTKEHVPP